MQTPINIKGILQAPGKWRNIKKLPQKFKGLSRKKKIIFGVICLVVVVAGFFVIRSLSQEPVAAQVTTSVVKKGDVKKVITATGRASLSQVMPLSFEKGGTVMKVYVKEGDVVQKDQPLVQLDTTTLEQELKEASENLASAQASYEQNIADLGRRVKSSLVQAEKKLLDAQKNADSYYLENQYHLAELNLKAASEKLANAQSSGQTDTYQLQVALSQAQLNLIDVRNKRDGGAAKDLEVAQADYDAALESFENFEKGISNEYLSARASLTQIETKLLTAQENLDKATLKAPMAGTITSSTVELYQNVSNTAVMSLVADAKEFTVSASVDQADITQIKVGQKVDMTLDTAPDKVLAGTVSGVSLKGTNTQNVITYGIKIDVDEPSELLRDQMNVNVSIITDEVKDVLTIPSRALVTRGKVTGVLIPKDGTANSAGSGSNGTNNQASGQSRPQGQRPGAANGETPSGGQTSSGGQIPSGGQSQSGGQYPTGSSSSAASGARSTAANSDYQFVQIEVGLNDGTNVEVKSGLSEGQVIIIQMTQAGATGNTSNQRSGTQGGLGMPNPMGAARQLR